MGAWSIGGNVLHSVGWTAGCGDVNSALKFGGSNELDFNWYFTEEYDGSAWACGGDLNIGRKELAGCGSQSAGLAFGGILNNVYQATTEEYDGSAWSCGGDLNTAREGISGAGTQDAGLGFGGSVKTGSMIEFFKLTEEYNGSAWATGGNLSCNKEAVGGAGLQTAALCVGGRGDVENYWSTEEYDGSAWASGGNTNDRHVFPTTFGTQISALCAGGAVLNGTTEIYNGTAWAVRVGAEQLTSRYGSGSAGVTSAGLSISGKDSLAVSNVTEEYDDAGELHKTWSTNDDFKNGKCSFVSFGRVLDELQLAGVWSARNSMNVNRASFGACGSSGAGLSFGGFEYGITATESTESYDGSVWSACENLNLSRAVKGAGTQLAALCAGGYHWYEFAESLQRQVETYDGSVWSLETGLNRLVTNNFVIGNLSDGILSFGGDQGNYRTVGSYRTAGVEEFTGVVWTNEKGLNVSKTCVAGAGIPASAICFGGDNETGQIIATTEIYDGTSWTIGNNMNVERRNLGGIGISTAALAFGGHNDDCDVLSVTEEFNGTSWCNVNSVMNTSRKDLSGCGTQSNGLNCGGNAGVESVYCGITEEYETAVLGSFTIDFDGTTIREWNDINWTATLPPGTSVEARIKSAPLQNDSYEGFNTKSWNPICSWNAGGDLNVGRKLMAGAGIQTAGLCFGGIEPGISPSVKTEKYNGSAWSGTGDMNLARSSLTDNGIQNAALSIGGQNIIASVVTEEFDGSLWSTGSDINQARYGLAACGTIGAGLCFGGYNGSRYTSNYFITISRTEEYDGTSWCSANNLNFARFGLAGCGTQTAGLAFGGNNGYFTGVITEEYNGTSWIRTADLSEARFNFTGFGSQNSALASGSNSLNNFWLGKNDTEEYNGISWVFNTARLKQRRDQSAGCGAVSAGLIFGGMDNGMNFLTSTEEYNSPCYYTQPIDIGCPDNRWYRLEFVLIADKSYTEPLFEEGLCPICSDSLKISNNLEIHNKGETWFGENSCKTTLINRLGTNTKGSPEVKSINQFYK